MNRAALAVLAPLALAPARATAGPPREGMAPSWAADLGALPSGWSTTYPDGTRTHPGSGELEAYVDAGYLSAVGMDPGLDPFTASRDRLDITARVTGAPVPGVPGSRFASGLLTTAGGPRFTYGYVEARMRMPRGNGLWPAFWMMRDGPAYGELDVVETLGEDPGKAYQTIHHGPSWEGRKVDQARTELPPGTEGDFHDYGVDWRADAITFYVDGKASGSFPTPPELHEPMYLLVDLAVGGPWGDPPDTAEFPATMSVEWIRAWKDVPDAAPRHP